MTAQLEAVARALRPSQSDMIRNMGDEPCVFGCGEGVAIRLSKSNRSRPALLEKGPPYSAEEPWPQFKLTEAGRVVRSLLTA